MIPNERSLLLMSLSSKQCSLSWFLKATDRYQMSVNIKGTTCKWVPKKLYFISNTSPKEWFNGEWDNSPQFRRRFNRVIVFKPLDDFSSLEPVLEECDKGVITKITSLPEISGEKF